jgi:hypothetical protein
MAPARCPLIKLRWGREHWLRLQPARHDHCSTDGQSAFDLVRDITTC